MNVEAARRDRELWPQNPFVHYGRNREGSLGRPEEAGAGATTTATTAPPPATPSWPSNSQRF